MCNFNDADCQSICFGSVSQHDMIHLAGSFVMQKHEVNQDSKHDTNQDPRLVSCRQKRTRAPEKLRR